MFTNDAIITLIIIVCIIFISFTYIALGLLINYQMDEYLYNDEYKYFSKEYIVKTPLYVLYLNMATTFSILMIIAFFIKSLFDSIIVPNIDISKYTTIYEMYTSSVLVITLATFSQVLNKQYKDIKVKLSGYDY